MNLRFPNATILRAIVAARTIVAMCGAIAMMLLGSAASSAQHGSAEPGFYPASYHGDIFSGQVVAVDEPHHQLTLRYEKKKKGSKEVQTFVGVTDSACVAPLKHPARETKELHLSAIPLGTVLTAYYNPEQVKNPDGSHSEHNVILAIRFDVVNGTRLTNPDRPIISCSGRWSGTNAY